MVLCEIHFGLTSETVVLPPANVQNSAAALPWAFKHHRSLLDCAGHALVIPKKAKELAEGVVDILAE